MKAHEHKYELKEKTVTLRNGVARDTLRMFVCECGKTTTFDLKRKKM